MYTPAMIHTSSQEALYRFLREAAENPRFETETELPFPVPLYNVQARRYIIARAGSWWWGDRDMVFLAKPASLNLSDELDRRAGVLLGLSLLLPTEKRREIAALLLPHVVLSELPLSVRLPEREIVVPEMIGADAAGRVCYRQAPSGAWRDVNTGEEVAEFAPLVTLDTRRGRLHAVRQEYTS